MTDKDEWQGRVGRSWAREWRRTDRSFSALTPRLIERALEGEFRHALDIGCGAGEIALELARLRPQARIVGIDVSEDLIEAARERAAGAQQIEFRRADAARWRSADADSAPQLLVSRHGVMFFEDPRAAFTHLRRVAADGARLVFSCFRDVADNPFFAEALRIADPEAVHAPPSNGDRAAQVYRPGPFGFSSRALVERVLDEAGWKQIEFERHDFPMIAGTGDDPVEDAVEYFSRIGPAARAIAVQGEARRAEILEQLRALARRNRHGERVTLDASCWIVSAQKPLVGAGAQ